MFPLGIHSMMPLVSSLKTNFLRKLHVMDNIAIFHHAGGFLKKRPKASLREFVIFQHDGCRSSRIVYENHILMNGLSKSEREAKLWFRGKRFSPTFLRKNVSYASNSIYQERAFTHHPPFPASVRHVFEEVRFFFRVS